MRETAARFIVPRFRALKDGDIRSKSRPNDLVTCADIEAEEYLTGVLPGLLPGSRVIGEEAVSRGEVSLDLLKEDGAFWIVDPVDGTSNFARGDTVYALMLALVDKGAARQGWIYDIPGSRMAVTEEGGGAFIDGARMQVNSALRDPAALSGHISTKYFPEARRAHVKQARTRIGPSHSLFCAAHEYLNILTGKADFAVYSRCRPWDHLAGTLMVREAGGYVAQWDGGVYRPSSGDIGLISAVSPDVWKTVRELFIPSHSPGDL